jgi:hypothetical protein
MHYICRTERDTSEILSANPHAMSTKFHRVQLNTHSGRPTSFQSQDKTISCFSRRFEICTIVGYATVTLLVPVKYDKYHRIQLKKHSGISVLSQDNSTSGFRTVLKY